MLRTDVPFIVEPLLPAEEAFSAAPVISFGGLDNRSTPDSAIEALSQVASLRERFGFRMKGIRLARKKSQEEFAELLGISVDFLSLIERGINAPSFENLDAFAAQLKMSHAELFTFPDETTSGLAEVIASK